MADKKKQDDREPGQGVLVRLPEAYREPLDLLKKRFRRPTTTEVQIALEAHFKSEGVKFALPSD